MESEFDKEIMEHFIETGRIQGADESFLKIFAVLYLEPEEMTMEELARKTGYSLASISNKIKFLESGGVIKKTHKPGSKRIYLYMEKDFLSIMKKQLTIKQERVIGLSKQRLPEIIKKYAGKIKTDKEKKKMRILEEHYKQVQKAEKIIPQIIDLINKA